MFFHVEVVTLERCQIQITNVSMGEIAKRYFYPFEMGEEINFYGDLISKSTVKSIRVFTSEERVELTAAELFAPNLDLSQIKNGLNQGSVWDTTEDFFAEVRGFINRFETRRAQIDDHSLLRTEAPSIWTIPKHPLKKSPRA